MTSGFPYGDFADLRAPATIESGETGTMGCAEASQSVTAMDRLRAKPHGGVGCNMTTRTCGRAKRFSVWDEKTYVAICPPPPLTPALTNLDKDVPTHPPSKNSHPTQGNRIHHWTIDILARPHAKTEEEEEVVVVVETRLNGPQQTTTRREGRLPPSPRGHLCLWGLNGSRAEPDVWTLSWNQRGMNVVAQAAVSWPMPGLPRCSPQARHELQGRGLG